MANLEQTKIAMQRLGAESKRRADASPEVARSIHIVEPGDMTRYELAVFDTVGAFGPERVFVWLNASKGGRSMILPDCAPDAGYIAQKMGIRYEYEAEVFAAWLTGRLGE